MVGSMTHDLYNNDFMKAEKWIIFKYSSKTSGNLTLVSIKLHNADGALIYTTRLGLIDTHTQLTW